MQAPCLEDEKGGKGISSGGKACCSRTRRINQCLEEVWQPSGLSACRYHSSVGEFEIMGKVGEDRGIISRERANCIRSHESRVPRCHKKKKKKDLTTHRDWWQEKKERGRSFWKSFSLDQVIIYLLCKMTRDAKWDPGLQRGISDLAISWGLKIELPEPIGQTGMSV